MQVKRIPSDGFWKSVEESGRLSAEVLKGNLDLNKTYGRSICWRLFLGVFKGSSSEEWARSCGESREAYCRIKNQNVVDPRKMQGGGSDDKDVDLMMNNPLAQDDSSPWTQFFKDQELRKVIVQDVERTFPDEEDFQNPRLREVMEDILFCYAKINKDLSYRQGMHELLALVCLVFLSDCDWRKENQANLDASMKIILDEKFVEHDCFIFFDELMRHLKSSFDDTVPETSSVDEKMGTGKENSDVVRLNFSAAGSAMGVGSLPDEPVNALVSRLRHIQNVLLKKADQQLFNHLQKMNVEPQLYGLRWFRLMFAREFSIDNVLTLWDCMFAYGHSLKLMDFIALAMILSLKKDLLKGDNMTALKLLMNFPLKDRNMIKFVGVAICLCENGTTGESSKNSLKELEAGLAAKSVNAKSLTTSGGECVGKRTPQKVRNKNVKLDNPFQETDLGRSQTLFEGSGGENSSASSSLFGSKRDLAFPGEKKVEDPDNLFASLKSKTPANNTHVSNSKTSSSIAKDKISFCSEQLKSFVKVLERVSKTKGGKHGLSAQQRDQIAFVMAGLKQCDDVLLERLPLPEKIPDVRDMMGSPEMSSDGGVGEDYVVENTPLVSSIHSISTVASHCSNRPISKDIGNPGPLQEKSVETTNIFSDSASSSFTDLLGDNPISEWT
eukprot:Nk52_evm22s252 gene=Nk52_evmTU22s252